MTAVSWEFRCPVHGERPSPTVISGGTPPYRFLCDREIPTPVIGFPHGRLCGLPVVAVYFDAEGNDIDKEAVYPVLFEEAS